MDKCEEHSNDEGGISKIKYVEIDKLKSAFIPPYFSVSIAVLFVLFLIGKNKFIP